MVKLRKIFTFRLNEAVDTCDISKASIQKATQKSKSTVMNWFNGTNMPSVEDLETIAVMTNRDPRWFYGADPVDKGRDQLILEIITKTQQLKRTEILEDILDFINNSIEIEEELSLNKENKEQA